MEAPGAAKTEGEFRMGNTDDINEAEIWKAAGVVRVQFDPQAYKNLLRSIERAGVAVLKAGGPIGHKNTPEQNAEMVKAAHRLIDAATLCDPTSKAGDVERIARQYLGDRKRSINKVNEDGTADYALTPTELHPNDCWRMAVQIVRVLNSLTARRDDSWKRHVVTLRDVGGFTFAYIADIFGVHPRTVSREYKARRPE